jgi:muramoyltetrapeptide carboxypeptidase
MEKAPLLAIMAPSYAPSFEDALCVKAFLAEQGIPYIEAGRLTAKRPGAMHADGAEETARGLVAMLRRPDVKVVWAARGGFGATRLLPYLEKEADAVRSAPPTVLAGYSDVTALHAWASRYDNVACLHAQTLKELSGAGRSVGGAEETLRLMKALLAGGTTEAPALAVRPVNDAARDLRFFSAPVYGGNLSLVQCGLGSPFEAAPAPGLLLLEDFDEPFYRLKRMLLHLEQSAMFRHVRAVLFGHLAATDLSPEEMREFVSAWGAERPFPVFRSEEIGHGPRNLPVFLGREHAAERQEDGGFLLRQTNTP